MGWASDDSRSFGSVTSLKDLKSLLCKFSFALNDKYISPISHGRFMASVILAVSKLESNPSSLRFDKTCFSFTR